MINSSPAMAVVYRRMLRLLPLLLLFVLHCSALTDFQRSFTRKVSTPVINPKCDVPQCSRTKDAVNIAYVKAEGPNDELHYLFSTLGPPTLVISRTKLGADLFINWTSTLTPGIVNSSTIMYMANGARVDPDRSFGIIFTRLYEFNDSSDTGDMSQISPSRSNFVTRKLNDFTWMLANVSSNGEISFSANLTENGTFTFMVRPYGADGRSDYSPHLEYTANSTEISLVLADIQNSTANSRFAIEMALYDSVDPNIKSGATSISTQQSLDDEYSPGVFQLLSWETEQSSEPLPGGGYAQWKPVCYTSPNMTRADLTRATAYPLMSNDSNDVWWHVVEDIGLVDFVFSTYTAASYAVNATNVSLGYSGDGFYTATNYTIWTVSVGLGVVPTDEVSILVIIIIAVGLGIPVILITIGGVMLCMRRRRARQATAYSTING